MGVPPFRLATFSLDSGTWVAEDVDEAVLVAAARRTIAGAAAMIGLEEGTAPLLRPGASCRWCAAADHCSAAIAAGEGSAE